jgi:hypothetical protein
VIATVVPLRLQVVAMFESYLQGKQSQVLDKLIQTVG